MGTVDGAHVPRLARRGSLHEPQATADAHGWVRADNDDGRGHDVTGLGAKPYFSSNSRSYRSSSRTLVATR